MKPGTVVVGIPSWNNARTVGHVVDCAVRGLAEAFPDAPGLVVNSDGGSADGTPEAVLEAGRRALAAIGRAGGSGAEVRSIRYRGISGKGSAFRAIFEEAVRAGARAVVVLDADLRSVTPAWIGRLAGPVVDGSVDYVAPLYQRHKFDGTITNSIVYPLTAAFYGGGIRQPIGGDFGFSGELAARFLGEPVWEGDVARFGIDLWMTTTALVGRFRIGQAHLGAKIHDPKDPGAHLAAMLAEVVGTAFSLLEAHPEAWAGAPPAATATIFGSAPGLAAEPVAVDVGRMEKALRDGVVRLEPLYAEVLPRRRLERFRAMASAGEPPEVDDDLWVATVLAFALAYRRRVLPRESLLRSLAPLYLGRTGSFVRRHESSTPEQVEDSLRRLLDVFAARRDPLARLWRSPDAGDREDLP